MSALSQFLILGQDRVRTQALSCDMTDFWTNSINATADIISETHTTYAMKRLLELNGMDSEGVRLEHSPAGDVDLTMLGDFFQKIGDKITWLPTDEIWLRGAAKLPEATADDILAEKEARAEKALQIQGQFQQRDDEDDMTATWYAAGTAPDDDERRLWEGRYQRLWTSVFSDQKKRVMKGAKELANG